MNNETHHEWPPFVEEWESKYRLRLDKYITSFRLSATQKTISYTNSELAGTASRISEHAKELLKEVRDFYKQAGIRANYDNLRELAIKHLINQDPGIDKRGLRYGMDSYSVQYPLLGLGIHMQVLAAEYKGQDSRSSHLSQWLVKNLISLSTQAGIPTDRTGSKQVKLLIDRVFEQVNTPDVVLKQPLERTITSLRSAYHKHGNTDEFWDL